MNTKQFRSEVRNILNSVGAKRPRRTYTDKFSGGGYSIMGGDRRVCFYDVLVPRGKVNELTRAVKALPGTVTGLWDLGTSGWVSVNIRGVCEL